ncbi:MAG: hypothetical protein J6U98_08730, partial [Abditibacteriota bacterium]|nr:hypothetical protein [Abditibacteriota bacterium]
TRTGKNYKRRKSKSENLNFLHNILPKKTDYTSIAAPPKRPIFAVLSAETGNFNLKTIPRISQYITLKNIRQPIAEKLF